MKDLKQYEYFSTELGTLYCGDCLEVLKLIEENSIDSIVTDPPYELGFMGKSWDDTGIANNVDMWKECLRVLKPGGHLLAFSGTRTYHRMAVAIEDAGFEVRDMIEWIYGSGFPKSHAIGKAVDKLQGNEREITGTAIRSEGRAFAEGASGFAKGEITLTKGTSEWEGWGTALKPAHENICVAHKRPDSRSVLCYYIIKILNNITEVLKCQLKSNVKIAKLYSLLSQVEQSEGSSIAVWNAVNSINIRESLSVLMGMLQSKETENLNLSIVSLCLNFLKEICEQMSIFTTEMETSLIIELKTLNSFLSADILANTIQAKETKQDGKNANACYAENYLNAVLWKWNAILTHSAQESVISKESNLNFAPNLSPICMARKPLAEKTIAENCLKWGTGGINIDESRVENTGKSTLRPLGKSAYQKGGGIVNGGVAGTHEVESEFGGGHDGGRFPANLIHDNSEEVRECFPDTVSKWGTQKNFNVETGDSGNASRFFKSIIYQAKASKGERNMGCEDIGGNKHCTVKPLLLMEYLIKMITPKGGTVLDPFMGSGTTGVACKNFSRGFIGIEQDENYCEIARCRMGQVGQGKFEF